VNLEECDLGRFGYADSAVIGRICSFENFSNCSRLSHTHRLRGCRSRLPAEVARSHDLFWRGYWPGSCAPSGPDEHLATIKREDDCWCWGGAPYGECCRPEESMARPYVEIALFVCRLMFAVHLKASGCSLFYLSRNEKGARRRIGRCAVRHIALARRASRSGLQLLTRRWGPSKTSWTRLTPATKATRTISGPATGP
jgi:hypothetical protein